MCNVSVYMFYICILFYFLVEPSTYSSNHATAHVPKHHKQEVKRKPVGAPISASLSVAFTSLANGVGSFNSLYAQVIDAD